MTSVTAVRALHVEAEMLAFTGWPAGAVAFYRGLEADNSKSYWTTHKRDYEAFVLAPMEALLADLEAEFGEGRIFRPYRDIRFSADKSPYKTAKRDKDLTAWIEWPVAPWLHTPDAETRVAEALRASRPLTDWLDAHVGPSTTVDTR